MFELSYFFLVFFFFLSFFPFIFLHSIHRLVWKVLWYIYNFRLNSIHVLHSLVSGTFFRSFPHSIFFPLKNGWKQFTTTPAPNAAALMSNQIFYAPEKRSRRKYEERKRTKRKGREEENRICCYELLVYIANGECHVQWYELVEATSKIRSQNEIQDSKNRNTELNWTEPNRTERREREKKMAKWIKKETTTNLYIVVK